MKYIIFLLLFLSCTHKQQVYEGGLFGERKIDDETYLISFHGNSFSNEQNVSDMLYLRCSEIALRNGYPYFIVIGGNLKKESKMINNMKLSEKNTFTNKIKLLMKPDPKLVTFDAKAIYSNRIREIEKKPTN